MSDSQLKHTLEQAIESFKNNPQSAKVIFRAQTYLVNGVLTNATIRKFNLNVDEPKELGGTDIAPNPVELLLAALGTCQEIVYSAYAAILGIELDSVSVDVKGELDLQGLFALGENINPGFQNIEYTTEIISPESREKLDNLVALVESHCPVLDTLTRSINVKGRVKINGNSKAA